MSGKRRLAIELPPRPRLRSICGSEIAGYLAMLAFLCAYLLNVADHSQHAQSCLNLLGAGVGAAYLFEKHAIPSVISNLAWAAITVAGVLVR